MSLIHCPGNSLPASSCCLFVYGSLLTRNCGRQIRLLLKRHSRSLGKASVPGRLLHLGAYPGMVESLNQHERITGEVLLLEHSDHTLPVLDKYECFDILQPENSEFIRVQRTARLDKNRREVACWVYIYAGNSEYLQPLRCGDFTRRVQT